MAKDDYEVIVYRVLVYLYACMKREIMYEEATFQASVRKNVDSDEYFADVLQMIQTEGLIEGLVFVGAWGGDIIMANSFQDAKITPQGIRYLKENAKMKQIGNALKESVDIISKLASTLMLFK